MKVGCCLLEQAWVRTHASALVHTPQASKTARPGGPELTQQPSLLHQSSTFLRLAALKPFHSKHWKQHRKLKLARSKRHKQTVLKALAPRTATDLARRPPYGRQQLHPPWLDKRSVALGRSL